MGLVRLKAEYAAAAWSPHTKNDVNNIESIQTKEELPDLSVPITIVPTV